MRVERYLVGTILTVFALLLIAYSVLLLWASFQSDLSGPFRALGVVVLLLTLPFVLSAWRTFSSGPSPFSWALIALVSFYVAFVSQETKMFGSPLDEIIRLALVGLAVGSFVAMIQSQRRSDQSEA